MLRNLGHQVTVVENGALAVEAVGKGCYDIVFMDIQMPVMDGAEATRLIRENERSGAFSRRVAIVAMTAHALKGDKEKYLENEMDAYISKPLYVSALEGIIESVAAQFFLPECAYLEGEESDGQQEQSAFIGFSAEGDTAGNAGNAAFAVPGHDVSSKAGAIDRELMYRSIGDDPDTLKQAMNIYLVDAPQLFKDMVAAVERGDNAALVNAAHALKGITAYYTREDVYLKLKYMAETGREKTLLADKAALEQDFHLLHKGLTELLFSIQKFLNEPDL